MDSQKQKKKTSELVMTALITALVFIAGSIIKIPTAGGFIHLGDCMVFLSVLILGSRKGALASGFGMALVDISGGYIIWAPFTFIIKACMVLTASFFIKNFNKKINNIFSILCAFLISGIIMILLYFAAGTLIAGFFTDNAGLAAGMIYASKDIIENILQASVGIIIAMLLSQTVVNNHHLNQRL